MFKYLKLLLVGLVSVGLMSGCIGGTPAPEGKVNASEIGVDAKVVFINTKAKYDGKIADNIKTECKIDSQVMEFIKIYAAKHKINVVINGKPKSDDLVLEVSITDALSSGGGMGHNKYIVISGKLYKGEVLESSFKAARRSGGGYFGMYRNSCSVLGSCAKTLGKDTAAWLNNPVKDAKLGDLYLIK